MRLLVGERLAQPTLICCIIHWWADGSLPRRSLAADAGDGRGGEPAQHVTHAPMTKLTMMSPMTTVMIALPTTP